MYRFRDIYVYVMYYVYVTSGPSLLIESTDSMISTQEHMGWKELQKNYGTSAQTKGDSSREETFRLGLTDGLVLYKVNNYCSR